MSVNITVEFFGTARLHVDKARYELSCDSPVSVCDLIDHLLTTFPNLAGTRDAFQKKYSVNLDGRQFLSGDEMIEPGQCLLVLSADAGG